MSDLQQLHSAIDVTSKDVEAIVLFVYERTAEQLVAHDPDSAEHKMALAVELMLAGQVEKLTAIEQAEQRGVPRPEHELAKAWNLFIAAAEPWRGTPGHDAARWRPVAHNTGRAELIDTSHTAEPGQPRREAGA
ncbi:hypothetical protein [Streptomyces sp. NPDC048349]|uniref:hypothetical protein n=1 Tax=Streptomyces sp. NPDC048349 TaxID=3155486 RepID=UPI003419C65E